MATFRHFWGCEVAPGPTGMAVEVEDGDRLNVCQVCPASAPLCARPNSNVDQSHTRAEPRAV